MKKKHLLLSLSILTLGISSTLVAGSLIKDVKVKYDPTIQFTLDGESVMKDKAALVYEDTVYVPLRAVSETLGYDVNYDNKTVIMDSRTDTTTGPAIEAMPIEEIVKGVTHEHLTILEVNKEQKSFVVGDKEDPLSQIVFRVSEDTSYRHEINKRIYGFDDLEVGTVVTVTDTGLTTMSIPAQMFAVDVVIEK